MRRKVIVVILLMYALGSHAQDAHFTLFENSPFFLNPGSAGMIDQSDYRATLQTRNQWRKMVKPANNTQISIDAPLFHFKGNIPNRSYMGIGFSYGYAGWGDNKTKQTNVNLSISGITTVGESKFLGLGIAVGKGGMRSDLSNATWSSQYDGYAYDASLPNNESVLAAKYKASYLDLSGGLNYLAVNKKSGAVTNIGVAYWHGNNPKIKGDQIISGNIDPRIVFHLRTEINLNLKNTLPVFLVPRVLFDHQGVHNDIQAGLSLFIVTRDVSKITSFTQKEGIEGGVMYRYGDAIGLITGYKTANWKFGLCYDITLSTWGEAVKRRGGTEISLIYYGINKSMRERKGIYLK